MKKIVSLICLIGIGLSVCAQNKIDSTGNVGIGTVNPVYPLDVVSDNSYTMQLRRTTDGEWLGIRFDTNLANQYGWLKYTHRDNLSMSIGGNAVFGASFHTGTSEGAGTGTLWQHSGALELYAPKNGWEKHITLTHIDKINYGRIIHDADGMKFRSYNNKHFYFRNAANSTSVFIHNNGNVGIGTTNVQAKLHISSQTEGDAFLRLESDTDNNKESDNPLIQLRQDGGMLGMDIGYDESNFGGNIFGICRKYSNKHHYDGIFINTGNGRIGIGTNTPSAKLDVAGNIKAHEIAVTLASIDDMQLNGTLAANNITYTANGNTADFVFEDNYQLKDLTEVEAFILTNKHLPEIPSATEMEEAGVNLAEMNKLLLMKVEELTLYAIEQDKKHEIESQALRDEIKQLDRELRERLCQLEKLLTK
jgi:hypothetical protein